jgi:2-methylcitrate dehydratase PrpD
MATAIERFAAWAAAPGPFSPVAREAAVHAIVDTLGCMLAGVSDEAARAVRRMLAPQLAAGGPAALAGGGRGMASAAALLNGTAAHALDFDDNFGPGMSHASAVMLPALLAVAGGRAVGGAALVEAYLVGLQAQAFVGEGVGFAHYRLGWHGTSTVGAIGSAAGCARLLGADARQMAAALSLATSTACGLKGQFGSPAKPFHAGAAARNAAEAALLAMAGLSGRAEILEGPQGFAELFGDGTAPGWAGWTPPEPGGHVIETVGVVPKRHPCCGSTHPSVDMVLDLRHAGGFAAEEVERVALRVGIANARNLAYPDPQDEMEARFSMQYCIARALRQDVLSLADFTSAAVGDPAIRALLPRVAMAAFSPEEEAGTARKPHEIVLTLKDGRVFTARRAYARGSLPDPFDAADREAKFRDCLGAVADAGALYRRLSALDTLPNLAAIETALSEQEFAPEQGLTML